MSYEKGKTYNFGGEQRLVLGFDASDNPITTRSLDGMPVTAEATGSTKADYRGLLKLLPLEKCNVAELQNVAEFIGVTLAATDEGKELSKAEIVERLRG